MDKLLTAQLIQDGSGPSRGSCLPAGRKIHGSPPRRPPRHPRTHPQADRGRGGGPVRRRLRRGALHAAGLPALPGGGGRHGARLQEDSVVEPER